MSQLLRGNPDCFKYWLYFDDTNLELSDDGSADHIVLLLLNAFRFRFCNYFICKVVCSMPKLLHGQYSN